ncbi:MAG: 4-hydroxythreonine-4-phosphate dehydrogenase PdxA [Muribaculaceae bacterium]|nr:4-hydroxythreonine-4-phosphate dehydrogenase PdxA [Muribaculaceae bacterium]
MSDKRKIRVGITHGDINGVGYEVILKALEDERMAELCTPIIYGSAKIAAYYRKGAISSPLQLNQVSNAADARDEQCNIINVIGEEVKVEPGVASEEAGSAAFAALERAVTDLRAGEIDVLVTAPINKHSIQSNTFRFPGHTEYLQASLAENGEQSLMIMCNPATGLRVALVTTHLPLGKVAEAVTKEAVAEKIKQFESSLKKDFGVPRPRISVLSLNPHAGEQGLLGSEEQNEIIPAIQECQAAKINCFGPYAADGFFGTGQFAKFDGVLAMYHDQGLAPFKTMAMNSGVNFTAGLPFVRTSPDHGTAYDIAGKGIADADSMRQAIFEAIDIYRNRARYEKAYANPLRRQYIEKNKSDNVVLDLTKSDDAE